MDNEAIRVLNKHATMATLSDLNAMLQGRVPTPSLATRHVEQAKRDGDSWYDDPDRCSGQVYKRLSGDFDYARELMKKINVGSVAGNIQSLQPDFEFGLLSGTEVDMDAYFRHDPRCLGRIIMPEIENGERIMRIAVGIGGNCGIDSETLVKRAAIVLKVVQEYSDAGYGVEVFAFSAGTNEYNGKEPHVAIIDCSRAVPGQVISAMASTKVFRSLVFAVIAMIPGINQYSLGYPVGHDQNAKAMPATEKLIKEVLGQNTKVIFAGADEKNVREVLSKK